ncbi:DUF1934 domain-containing protein [Halonatronum saccharophilum]|uniref:DUF1934 domain-containing protein n=1 Tax=Halonatronum saccharophilum TaxID=150060 RepID=UPI001B7F9DC6|nr:DUF1934 domain-containing protein [Halonatronum saccharophilum]
MKISIDSIQYEGEEKSQITSDIRGNVYDKGGVYYIKYEDNLEGLKGVKTTLKVKDDILSIIRQGKVRSIQEFNAQEKTDFEYKTQYGVLNLGIEVHRMGIDVGPSSGRIKVDYNLYDQEGRVISRNTLNISYEEE